MANVQSFTQISTATISVGNYGASLSTVTFFFYRTAYIYEVHATAWAFETASGIAVRSFAAYFDIDGLFESNAYLVTSSRKIPRFFIFDGQLTQGVYRYAGAKEDITMNGDVRLTAVAGKETYFELMITLLYTIQ